jgi:hypothetical protein
VKKRMKIIKKPQPSLRSNVKRLEQNQPYPRHMSTTVGMASAYVIVCMMAGSAGTAAATFPASSSFALTPGAPTT